jgi:nitroreductase
MHVSEALQTRQTCRTFLDRRVDEAVVRSILTAAARAPSGGNLQPWQVWCLAGPELQRLKALIAERIAFGEFGNMPMEYLIYPTELAKPYGSRKFWSGEVM